jgi:5-methylcytosine-specific restriction endonuclease McrA
MRAGIARTFQHRTLLAILCDAQDDRCGICGGIMDRRRAARRQNGPNCPSIDHVMPQALGGWKGRGNVVAAHVRCNTAKGARWPTPGELAFLDTVNAALGWARRTAA